jgi:BA14K-like protein
MKNIKAMSAGLALLLGAGTLALGHASASPMSGNLGTRIEPTSQIQLVASNPWWYKHGRRHRDHDHRHFHNGLWFAVPFWLGATALAADRYDDGDYGGAHVEYCLSRYRSYDPASNTFLGYDGLRHECVGPY